MALLEAKLVQKLEKKKREGWTINHARFFEEKERQCCLLGAQCDQWPKFVDDYQEGPARLLGITVPQAYSLEWGFMGSTHLPDRELEPDFVELGAKLRSQYQPPKP